MRCQPGPNCSCPDNAGPFDPKRLVEQALLQLRTEIEESKQRAAGAVATGRARLAELINIANVFTDSQTLLQAAKAEIAQPVSDTVARSRGSD